MSKLVARLDHPTDPRWLVIPGPTPPDVLRNDDIWGGVYGRLLAVEPPQGLPQRIYRRLEGEDDWRLQP